MRGSKKKKFVSSWEFMGKYQGVDIYVAQNPNFKRFCFRADFVPAYASLYTYDSREEAFLAAKKYIKFKK